MEWFENIWNGITAWFTANWPALSEKLADVGLKFVGSLIIIVLGWWLSSILSRIVRSALKKSKLETSITGFIYSAVKTLLRVLVIISAIAMLDINISSIIAALGAAGITLGLAMQDSLSNFASGVVLLFNRPFKVGDYINVDEAHGTVARIDLMYTSITTSDNKEIILPNSMLTKGKIYNCTRNESRRLELQFPVAYESDVALVKNCILAASKESPFVNQAVPAVVGIREFAARGVIYELRTWIKSDDYWAAYFDMQERVKSFFDANNIEIPRDRVDVKITQK